MKEAFNKIPGELIGRSNEMSSAELKESARYFATDRFYKSDLPEWSGLWNLSYYQTECEDYEWTK